MMFVIFLPVRQIGVQRPEMGSFLKFWSMAGCGIRDSMVIEERHNYFLATA